jgi:transcriptional regulator GlxA family with amidase domain
MKRITLVIPEGYSNLTTMACLVGSYEILSIASDIWQARGNKQLFTVSVAGVSDKQEIANGMFSMKPDILIKDLAYSDVIIVPSINKTKIDFITENRELLDWIAHQYKKGAEIASMCTGAFILAASGILEGKTCSTHWSLAETFRAKYPEINLMEDKLITDENGVYTNGGAYSFLNLLLYLIEKFYDRQLALQCAKIFQIDISRQAQSEFIIFSNQKIHNDNVIKEAQEFIENNVSEKLSVDSICETFSVARRNFDRRFLKATGNTPLEYIQRVKIEAAKRNLELSRKTINEIMYEVGYSDTKAFREVFRKFTGLSPNNYKRKYSMEVI